MNRAVLAVLLVLGVVAACSSDDPYAPLPKPDPVDIEETTTTTEVDLSGVPLAPVIGSTSTTMAIGPGPVTIVGHVEGPDGVVGDAIVQLERLVGESRATMRVPTAPDGTWNAANVLGGRYRVRAWRAPDLASARSVIVFVESRPTHAIDLRIEPVGGVRVDAAIAPDPPYVDEDANLKVRVAERTVDGDGIVRDRPVSGAVVSLSGSGEWSVSTINPSRTQSDGSATFRVSCRETGNQPLFATIDGGESYALALQPCVERGATTTSSASTSSTSSTSTSSSSTSTTAP